MRRPRASPRAGLHPRGGLGLRLPDHRQLARGLRRLRPTQDRGRGRASTAPHRARRRATCCARARRETNVDGRADLAPRGLRRRTLRLDGKPRGVCDSSSPAARPPRRLAAQARQGASQDRRWSSRTTCKTSRRRWLGASDLHIYLIFSDGRVASPDEERDVGHARSLEPRSRCADELRSNSMRTINRDGHEPAPSRCQRRRRHRLDVRAVDRADRAHPRPDGVRAVPRRGRRNRFGRHHRARGGAVGADPGASAQRGRRAHRAHRRTHADRGHRRRRTRESGRVVQRHARRARRLARAADAA